jgi:hypothetical protein
MQQIGTNRWVRSPESRGWVWEGDLPPAKFKAMYDRIIDTARARAAAAGKKWEEPDPKITGAIF